MTPRTVKAPAGKPGRFTLQAAIAVAKAVKKKAESSQSAKKAKQH